MADEWSDFSRVYDDSESEFGKRLALTQDVLRSVLDATPSGATTLLDLCAGAGRVVLPVLATHARGPDVHAWLVDSDPLACEDARETVDELHLSGVEVVTADAGRAATYAGFPRADIVVLSGVLHHLWRRDARRTVAGLRQVCAADATLIWTLGWAKGFGVDDFREELARAGFRELEVRSHGTLREHEAFVGTHRMEGSPEPLERDQTWFRFRRRDPGLLSALGHARRTARKRVASLRRG